MRAGVLGQKSNIPAPHWTVFVFVRSGPDCLQTSDGLAAALEYVASCGRADLTLAVEDCDGVLVEIADAEQLGEMLTDRTVAHDAWADAAIRAAKGLA
jgi:hypothetical protein